MASKLAAQQIKIEAASQATGSTRAAKARQNKAANALRVVSLVEHLRQQPPASEPSTPPSLRPRQRVLERRLRGKSHLSYMGLAWHQRTHLFTEAWDQARKRHTFQLGTFFTTPGPRWQHADWWHFDQGRRMADLFGARYEQWIAAQYARVACQGRNEAAPSDLHGRVALEAYLHGGQAGRDLGPDTAAILVMLGTRPFDSHSYDRQDPAHNLYVVGILSEMIDLTQMLGAGRGLDTDSVSADDLWLVLSSFDADLLIPRPKPVPVTSVWRDSEPAQPAQPSTPAQSAQPARAARVGANTGQRLPISI